MPLAREPLFLLSQNGAGIVRKILIVGALVLRKKFARPRLKDVMGDGWEVDMDSLLPMKMQEAARKTAGKDGQRR